MSWLPLVGHEAVLERLRQALIRGRLGHALLFVGPEGVGKLRTARHLAQGLLCETRPAEKLEPCGRCSACQQVQSLFHPDYFEVHKPEEKNELPILAIRELCEKISYKPARGRYRVVVINDAERLNEESSNCFLKTLEEPPPHSLLILVAANAGSLLPTITSRCQTVRFAELSADEVAGLLLKLGVTVDREAALRAARWSGGSVGAACDLVDPEWSVLRQELLTGFLQQPIQVVPMIDRVQQFVEEAGSSSGQKRDRAKRIVRMVADVLGAVLRQQTAGIATDDPNDNRLVGAFAGRFDSDTLVDLIDRCRQADFHIGRFLLLPLSIECWLDDLAQMASGQVVFSEQLGVGE